MREVVTVVGALALQWGRTQRWGRKVGGMWRDRTRWLATRPRWLRVSLVVILGITAAPLVIAVLTIDSVIVGYVREHVALLREMWRERPYGYERPHRSKIPPGQGR